MPFQIRRIRTRVRARRFRHELLHLMPSWKQTALGFLEVEVLGNDGFRGYGETPSSLAWSGESVATAQLMIGRKFAPRLTGCRIEHPREALAILDATTHANPFTKGALETAIWDCWARGRALPAGRLFGDRPPPAAIPTRASLIPCPPRATVRLARHFRDLGIRTLKFKVGAQGMDDVARLRAVRDIVGHEAVFTLDANGAYATAREALRALDRLRRYSVSLIEQPTPRDRLSMMAEVKRHGGIPVMADEGVFTRDQLAEALDLDAFDVLALSPGKNGGFTHSIDMAREVARAGKHCSIGSNLESDLGQAAMLSLAANLKVFPVEQVACDLPASLIYAKSSVKNPLPMQRGRVAVPAGSGFGVDPA